MLSILFSRLRGSLAVASLALCGLSAFAQAPLESGLRWIHPAPAADAWIPASVTFVGAPDLVLAAAKGASPRLMTLDVPAGPWPAARATELDIGAGQGALEVLASADATRAFALLQPQVGSEGLRRVQLRRVDPTRSLELAWFYEMGISTPAEAHVCMDAAGERVVVAAHSPSTGKIVVDWVDGDTGGLLVRRQVVSAGLRGMALSADGSRLALQTPDSLDVFGPQGILVDSIPIAATTKSVAFDQDGDTVIIGGHQELSVWRESAAGDYELDQALPGGSSWYALEADLAGDGQAAAIGWWDGSNGRSTRYEVWNLASGQRTFQQTQTSSQLQHLPSAVLFSPDGRRVAFGGWGADQDPEVLWVDAVDGVLLQEIQLPGSVEDLALDASGERLAVAHKDAHANLSASTGAVRLFATGEAELELLTAPAPQGELRLAARHPEDQGFVFFLVGQLQEPQLLNKIGTLWIERSSLAVYVRPTQQGRADLSLPLSLGPEWVGQRLAVQAAFRGADGLSLGETVLQPLVLD